jgi:hypothetical protein
LPRVQEACAQRYEALLRGVDVFSGHDGGFVHVKGVFEEDARRLEEEIIEQLRSLDRKANFKGTWVGVGVRYGLLSHSFYELRWLSG